MKKLIIAASLSVVLMSATSANAKYMDPSLERNLVRICEALKSDQNWKLRKAIKKSRASYSAVVKGLVCNGKDALTFAQEHGAHKTSAWLAKRGTKNETSMLAKR